MLGKFKGKALAVVLVTVMLSISLSPMIFNNQMGTQPQSSQSGNYPSTIFGSLQQYAQEHGTTVEQLTANWTANDWIRWYKYEGNPSWGSTNITDQFLATDWVKLPNSGNLTWGADYDYVYKYNATSDQLEMWHNGTLVSYLGSDDLWHYASDRPNLTGLHHIVDKQYVDYAVASLGARYYMIDDSSGIADYKLTQLSPSSGSEQSVTKTGLADDDYIAGWISPDTSLNKLIKGVYNWYIYAEKTGGTQTLRLYWQLVERKSDTTETVIATSAVSNEISTSKGSYIIPLTLSEDYTLADGSYVVGKLYVDVSGGGSAPDVAIYFNGTSKSHWEIPVNLEIFSNQFLKLDGSNANSDIDITPYNLTVNNISAFNLKSSASYIIWTDGTTVYAMNGSTGEIDYSGTDASSVIQNVLDNTSGVVFMKNGLYLLNKAIEIKNDGTMLVGEGENTILKRADVVESALSSDALSGQKDVVVNDASSFMVGQQVFIGKKSSTDNTWEINRIASISGNTLTMEFNLANSYTVADGDVVYTAYHVIEAFSKSNIAIRNLYIDGNKANNYYYSQYDTSVTADYYEDDGTLRGATFLVQNGIYLEKCNHSLVENIHVKNNIGWGGIVLYKTDNSVVRKCHTEYGVRHGIIIFHESNYNQIISCYSNNNGETSETYPRHNYIVEGSNVQHNKLINCVSLNGSMNGLYLYTIDDLVIDGFYDEGSQNSINFAGSIKNVAISSSTFHSMVNIGDSAFTESNIVISNSLFIGTGDTKLLYLIHNITDLSVSNCLFYEGYITGTGDSSAFVERATISNCVFYNTNAGDYGINFYTTRSVRDFVVTSCLAYNAIISIGYSGYTAENIVFSDNIVSGSSGYSTLTLSEVDSAVVKGNVIHDSNYGIYVMNSINCKISDNTLYNLLRGVFINGASVSNIDIINNNIHNCTAGVYGMNLVTGANIRIMFNTFQSLTYITTYLPSDVIYFKNVGYTTENSGSSEITGTGSDTSFTISHGLATTPSQVLITPTNSSMASATWWVSAKSSTTFTITFSSPPSSGTKFSFDWYAEV